MVLLGSLVVVPAFATMPSNSTTFSSIGATTTYQILSSGYATPATLTQTNIASSGYDISAVSNSNGTAFSLRGINSAGFGSGDSTSVRVQSGGISYVDITSNGGAYVFDFTSMDIRFGGTGAYTLQALTYDGSSYSTSGAAITVTVSTSNAFASTGDMSLNNDFKNIYGVRIAPTTLPANISPYFDNIQVTNVRVPSLPAPTATTGAASSITATGATLSGTVNDNGAATTVTFDYGTTTGYGTNTAATTGGTVSPGAGSTASSVAVSGLSCNTTYHFRVRAISSSGTTSGNDATFTTGKCAQTIVFNNPGAQAFGTTPTLTASASSNLAVSFTSATTGICTITSGGALTFVAVGSCTINADQAGTSTFLAASQVSQTFAVNAVPPGVPLSVSGAAGDSQVFLSWSAPASIGGSALAGYSVQVSTAAGGPYANAAGGCAPASTNANLAASCTATGLANGFTYYFKVAAINSAGTGSYSSASAGVALVSSAPPPPVVSTMQVIVIGVNGLPVIANLTSNDGPAFLAALRGTLGTVLASNLQFAQQTVQGTVVLSGYQGGSLAFMPHSYQASDSRADGIYPMGDGRYQVVSNGTSATLAPAVLRLEQLAALFPGVNAMESENGVITADVSGTIYVVQPSVGVTQRAATGSAILTTGVDGYFHFVDAQGNDQILYPAFREYSALRAALRQIDPSATLNIELNGTATLVSGGLTSSLVPDVTLILMPASRMGQALWQESANRWCYANNQFQPVAGRAQCYTVR